MMWAFAEPTMGARLFWLSMILAGIGSAVLFMKSMSDGDDDG